MSNSPLVFVDSCQFTNNTSEGIGTGRYSGNSGGVSIGFADNVTPQNTTPHINIMRTTFTHNTADAREEFRHDISYVFREKVYNQRGGAMAIYTGSPNYNAVVRIHDCIFKSNKARDSGGGVYLNMGGRNNNHSVFVTDTHFIENDGPDGGGLEITLSRTGSVYHHMVIVSNCQFLSNNATFGGGYKSYQVFTFLSTVNLYNCTFINNTAQVGAAMYLQSVYTLLLETLQERSVVQDW